ncbi:MAG: peptidylprolyl isomerase [Planctomycetota bacterium]|jgi:hypothetical protein|nr:peptidylprolyl isomerase [Planctomycetota bacterium]
MRTLFDGARGILFLAALFLAGFSPVATAEDALTSHRILVKVGTENITQKDFDDMGEVIFKLYYPNRDIAEITPGELEQLNPLALKELIVILLAEDEVKQLTGREAVRVTSSQIVDYMRDFHLDKLYQNRIARRYAQAQLGINQITRLYVAEPTPSPSKVKNFYRLHTQDVFVTPRFVKVRHILLSAEPQDAAAERRARGILADLQKLPLAERVEEFKRVARNVSADRFKQNSGLIILGDDPEGWILPTFDFQMPDGTSLFPAAAVEGIRALQTPGEVLLRSSERGWHLLLLEDAKGGETIPYGPVARGFIENYLSNEALDAGREKWLRNKTQRTRITWNDGTDFPVDKVLLSQNEEARLRLLHQQVIRATTARK